MKKAIEVKEDPQLPEEAVMIESGSHKYLLILGGDVPPSCMERNQEIVDEFYGKGKVLVAAGDDIKLYKIED